MPSKTLPSPTAFRRKLWEILPQQGEWTQEQYLAITDTQRHVEYTDGDLEFLPMPTDKHQSILEFLFVLLQAFVKPRGKVHVSGLRLQIREGMFREPDLVLLRDSADPRRDDRFWTGADLVVEVVSPDDPDRDLVQKRRDYAEGGVAEYWIVNPLTQRIIVLTLEGKKYRRVGMFSRGSAARSVVLDGFEVKVSDVFDAD
jgi:Uma2 family endonuclease